MNAYDHILDVRGMKKMKTAREIAEQRGFRESLRLLDILDKYQVGTGTGGDWDRWGLGQVGTGTDGDWHRWGLGQVGTGTDGDWYRW